MELSGSWSAAGRRTVVALGLVALVGVSSGVQAQTPAPAQAAAAAPADPLKFGAGSQAAILYVIKPEKVADFEGFWTGLKAKVAASDKADLKAQVDGIKVFKVGGGTAAQPSTYIFWVENTAALSYSPIAMLYESGVYTREDADKVYATIKDAWINIAPWPLIKM